MTTEQRLDMLENELKRAKVFIGCLLGTFVSALIIGTVGAASTEWPKLIGANKIIANSFFLKNEEGKTTALLTTDEKGPSLNLFDENGKTRILLNVTEGQPSLILSDENGKLRAALGYTKSGPSLLLFDENGSVTKSFD
jgi:hypothetical protein